MEPLARRRGESKEREVRRIIRILSLEITCKNNTGLPFTVTANSKQGISTSNFPHFPSTFIAPNNRHIMLSSIDHMMPCLIQPIPSCAIMGGGECARRCRLLCLFGVASDLVNQLAHPLIFPSFVLVFMGIDAIQGAPLSVRSWGELIS